MWMKHLLTAITKSPKFRRNGVTHVTCYGCKKTLRLADAYVDGHGWIWCRCCK